MLPVTSIGQQKARAKYPAFQIRLRHLNILARTTIFIRTRVYLLEVWVIQGTIGNLMENKIE